MTTVMHLHWKFAIGGAETHIYELALEQKKSGLVPIIVARQIPNKRYLHNFRKHNICFYKAEKINDVIQLIKSHEVELLHAHSSRIYQEAIHVSKCCDIPLLFTLHGVGAVRQLRAGNVPELISVSEEIQDLVKESYKEATIHVIENGINLTNHIPLEKSEGMPAIAYVGRVDTKKLEGVLNLHEAIKELSGKVDFTSVSTLKKQNFDVLGGKLRKGVTDSSIVLNNSDIVVGTGRAIMEGMASGNTGIVLGEFYDGPVTPENVEKLRYNNFSGRSSKRVPEKNEILNDINNLLKYPVVLRELQQWSREYAKNNFDIQDKVKEHIKIYSSYKV